MKVEAIHEFRLHGKALQFLRINSGMKSSEVAEALGVTRGLICHCEKNRHKLTATRTKKFLELIGTSEEDAKAFYRMIENN